MKRQYIIRLHHLCCRLLLHFHQYSTRDIQTSEFRSMKYQILNKYTWFSLRGLLTIFTARRYAQARSLLSAGVCPSVCPSRSCIISRRLKISSNFFHGQVAHHSSLLIQWCSPRDQSLGLETPRGQKIKSWSWSWSWDPESWSWSWSWGKSLGLGLGLDKKVLRIFNTFMVWLIAGTKNNNLGRSG